MAIIASGLVGCGRDHSTRAMSVGGLGKDPGYSIWIMSDERSQQAFAEKIREISSTCRGAEGPFLPHVTLIGQVQGGEFQVLAQTRSLAGRIAAFRMHLVGFGATEERFRQLFIEIERDGDLTMARVMAEKTFGKKETGEYMPHLSLAYGNIERDTKTRIISAAKGLLDRELDAKLLAVVRTPEELKDWKMVGVFPLAGRPGDPRP